MTDIRDTAEGRRLSEARTAGWRRWGPYPSDRQWGTVREDYSRDGDAWTYFPHAHARSRAYRWGEDALAGFGDEHLHWCLGLALWNGQDAILKERLFGLTNAQGNHGEDVKELYFYTDALPSHCYLRMLYKYPHAAFPYEALLAENARRDQSQPEYELLDTGVMEGFRFCDVTVEYARAAPDDTLMRITVRNRADVPTKLHVLPHLWARNIWSWSPDAARPSLTLAGQDVLARHAAMPELRLSCDQAAPFLFCENETNDQVLFGVPRPDGYAGPFKDGIGDFVVHGAQAAIRRDHGTKCAAHVVLDLPAHGAACIRLRLRPEPAGAAFDDFDAVMINRQAEADEFYAVLQQGVADEDARLVQRQALAGLIWSKQYYGFDVRTWLAGDPTQPAPPPERREGRDADWQHLVHADIVSMPDKWEYPWYASWDLAFHAVTFALIDPEFAKGQMLLLLRDRAMHPNGQVPAYEWKFGDANPPVQAWGAWRVYEMDRALTGHGDRAFLTRAFNKLLLNFGWWVNRKDARGRNIFQGGFLGLDNIEIFDRSQPLPTGGCLQQADGTAWMAAYALHMMRIALELAQDDGAYQDIAAKFFEHFLYIAAAMNDAGLWDDTDSFFYDLLQLPDGAAVPLRVHSIVGLIPLFAVHVLDPSLAASTPDFAARMDWFLAHRPDLAGLISHWHQPGEDDRQLLSLLRTHRMTCLLRRMLDPAEFLSDHGVRAVSKFHAADPYVLQHDGHRFQVSYVPGESDSRQFGGNSNWRGPVWMPINFLLVQALLEFDRFYGDGYKIACPTGTEQICSLREVARTLAGRLTGLFLKGTDGRRPVMAAYPGLDDDPEARDLILFHEYFHGDTGRGVGASHQTGWSALVALLLAS